MTISNKLLGDAGEHYVAYRLAMLGINPALLSTNSKGADILATNTGKNVVSIQVKTSSGRNAPMQWDLGKHRPDPSEIFFYIFLNLWDDHTREIECFIVPSNYIADENNVNWSTSRPQFKLSKKNKADFLNRWDLIEAQLPIQ